MKKSKEQIMKERAMKGFAHFGIKKVKAGREILITKAKAPRKKA